MTEESAEAPRTPSEEELQALEGALRAASPLPWRTKEADSAHVWVADGAGDLLCDGYEGEWAMANGDAAVAAVNAAPSLISEVRKARAALAARDAEWREALRALLIPVDEARAMAHANPWHELNQARLRSAVYALEDRLRALLSEGKPSP